MWDWLTNNWQDVAGVAGAIGGSWLNSQATSEAAEAQMNAANQAAEMSKFTPYGVTTGFGSSYFDTKNQRAGYVLDPALQAYRDQLFTLGAQGLPTQIDPTAQAQTYYDEIQQMMQPARQQEQNQLQQNLFGSGRLGMRLAGEAAGAGSGGMYQPDVLGYQKAQELANQQLAQQARLQSMNELDQSIARGTGLMQTGFGVEQLGMQPLSLGTEIGGRATTAGANAAQALLGGAGAAAQANLAGSLGMSNTFKDLGLGLMQYGGGRGQ